MSSLSNAANALKHDVGRFVISAGLLRAKRLVQGGADREADKRIDCYCPQVRWDLVEDVSRQEYDLLKQGVQIAEQSSAQFMIQAATERARNVLEKTEAQAAACTDSSLKLEIEGA